MRAAETRPSATRETLAPRRLPTKPHAITARTGVPSRSYTYDEWGNRTSKTGPGVAEHYTYNSANQIVCIGTSAGPCDTLRIGYDASGLRVREETGDTVRYFLGDEAVVTLLPAGERQERFEVRAFGERVGYYVWNEVKPRNASGPGLPPILLLHVFPGFALLVLVGYTLSRREAFELSWGHPARTGVILLLMASVSAPFPVQAGGGGATFSLTHRWVFSDKVGSGMLVVDENGDLVRHTRYQPFGEVDAESPPLAPGDRRFYAGHPQQEDTSLTYMKARWMDPESGMFLSVDPLILPSDPQSHNAYTYARNNPISNTDPTGAVWVEYGAGSTTYHFTAQSFYGSQGDRSFGSTTFTRSDGSSYTVETTGSMLANMSNSQLANLDAASGQTFTNVGGQFLGGIHGVVGAGDATGWADNQAEAMVMATGEALRGGAIREMIADHSATLESVADTMGHEPNLIRALIFEEQAHLLPGEAAAENLGFGDTVGLGQVTVGSTHHTRAQLLLPRGNIEAMGIHISRIKAAPLINANRPIASIATAYNGGLGQTAISAYGNRVEAFYARFSCGYWR